MTSPAKPVRVCFVIENLIPAGTELWLLRLIESIDRNRVEPSLCILNGSSEISRNLEPANCQILRLEMPSLRSISSVKKAAEFYRFLRQNEIEVVQLHHADPTYFATPIARLARVSTILQTKYDVGYWLKGFDLWLHRLMRPMINITVANCEACKTASVQQEWSRPESVVVVDNGIPLDEFLGIPDLHLDTNASQPNIGLVGNLRPIKDPANFVKAAKQVIQSHPGATFHLAGRGELREPLENLAQELGIGENVVLHGSVKDIPGFLAKMDISVLCSKSEGLPHAVLEYMAAGRAIVVSDVGGNPEVITDNQTGLLVPPSNPDALGQAINRFLADPALANRCGRAARNMVRSRFSMEAMTERFGSFYWDLRRQQHSHVVARELEPTSA